MSGKWGYRLIPASSDENSVRGGQLDCRIRWGKEDDQLEYLLLVPVAASPHDPAAWVPLPDYRRYEAGLVVLEMLSVDSKAQCHTLARVPLPEVVGHVLLLLLCHTGSVVEYTGRKGLAPHLQGLFGDNAGAQMWRKASLAMEMPYLQGELYRFFAQVTVRSTTHCVIATGEPA
jgi:hypothetical protein